MSNDKGTPEGVHLGNFLRAKADLATFARRLATEEAKHVPSFRRMATLRAEIVKAKAVIEGLKEQGYS